MRKILLAVLIVATVIFYFAPSNVLSQSVVPNTTFFPDLEQEEIQACAQQASYYVLIAKMRDGKVPKERVIEKLVKEGRMNPEMAKKVVESVYEFDGSVDQIKGQIMGECLTTLSYEKLIKESKYI